MSPYVALFAWTSPGAQAKHMKVAAQMAFVVVKELTVLFVGADDDNYLLPYLNSYSESTV